jgi:putative phage-type endonuclease
MATVTALELVNIIDELEIESIFTEEEYSELFEQALELIDAYMQEHLLELMHAHFMQGLRDSVEDVLIDQISDLYDLDVEPDVQTVVHEALLFFFQTQLPPREYATSCIRRWPNLEALDAKLHYLQSIPQPEQRTPEWYEVRSKYLTASSIWKAFGTESTRNQLIYDKCKPFNPDKYGFTSTDSTLHWGHKYEPLSVMLYEHLYDTKVSDFGCLPHRTLPFLAASPDGINTLKTSARYGRMLEIKNIVNRVIDGNPKMEYWIQMQVQMEVCDLNECDFLETRFKEYDSFAEFEADASPSDPMCYNKTASGDMKGIILQFNQQGQPFYVYAPVHVLTSNETFDQWMDEQMTTYRHLTWIQNIYWRLDQLSCILVLRNKRWFQAAVPVLQEIWAIIQREKANGYEHRAPKKRLASSPATGLRVTKLNDTQSTKGAGAGGGGLCHLLTQHLFVNTAIEVNTTSNPNTETSMDVDMEVDA